MGLVNLGNVFSMSDCILQPGQPFSKDTIEQIIIWMIDNYSSLFEVQPPLFPIGASILPLPFSNLWSGGAPPRTQALVSSRCAPVSSTERTNCPSLLVIPSVLFPPQFYGSMSFCLTPPIPIFSNFWFQETHFYCFCRIKL